MKLEIPIKCPSWNELYSGKHWSVRKNKADEIHDLVLCIVSSYFNKQGFKQSFKKCLLTFVCQYKAKRRHDPDNCMCKYFTDGLVHAGVIADDNSDVVKLLQIIVETGCEEDKVIIIIE